MTNNLEFNNSPTNISEQNIYANYKLIHEILETKFTDSHRLQTFISYLRHRVYLIEIEIDKDKDVAMVFEVINDRGVLLKPYEILKGKILSQITISDREKYINIWESKLKKIEEFGESEIDEFFGFYFRSKYAENSEQYNNLDKSRYHKTIFTDDYNERIGLKNSEKNARYFVEEILPYFSEIYIHLLRCHSKYTKSYEHIYFNGLNKMDGQVVLTLSSIDLNDPDKDEKIRKVPQFYDKFFSISNLTNSYKSNEFNSNIISLTPAIRSKTIDETEIKFEEQLLSLVSKNHDRTNLDTAFKYEFFKNIGYNQLGKTFLRYFFARIDHYISDFSDINEYGTYYQLVVQTKGGDVYHVEHILTNVEDNEKLFKDDEEFNEQRNRLGCLLLLKGKDNQSSKDELYKDKLHTYNVLGTYYARTLLPDMYTKKVAFKKYIEANNLNFKPYPDKYAKVEIEERHQLLFELAKRIWNCK